MADKPEQKPTQNKSTEEKPPKVDPKDTVTVRNIKSTGDKLKQG